jgi:[histone H3]-lysine27 N-trimethyltransferase EZH2
LKLHILFLFKIYVPHICVANFLLLIPCQNRIGENKTNISSYTQRTYNLSKNRQISTSKGTDSASNLLTKRQDDALCTLHSLDIIPVDKDGGTFQDESPFSSSNVMFGGNLGPKNAIIRPIKLPEVPKLPPYTTWIFLDRSVYNYRLFLTFQTLHMLSRY